MCDEAAGTACHCTPVADDAGHGALEGELARIETLLAPDAVKESGRELAGRHAKDAEVVGILRTQGFTGPLFNRFAGRLMEYAWPVMLNWTATDEIFRQARLNRCPVPAGLIVPWTLDDRFEIVADSLLAGIEGFRNNALAGGRWDPAKGASLKTYYVRACIFAFRTVFATWSTERTALRNRQTCTGLDDDPVTAIPDQRAPDPCHTAVIHDEVDRMLPLVKTRELRAALAWRGAGCTQEEAAQLAGLTVKALEGRLARVRTKARAQNSEGGAR